MTDREADSVEVRLQFTDYYYEQIDEMQNSLQYFCWKAEGNVNDPGKYVANLNALLLQTINEVNTVNELSEFYIKRVIPSQLLYSIKPAPKKELSELLTKQLPFLIRDLVNKEQTQPSQSVSLPTVPYGLELINKSLGQSIGNLLRSLLESVEIMAQLMSGINRYFDEMNDRDIEDLFARQLQMYKEENIQPLANFAEDTGGDPTAGLRYLRGEAKKNPIVKEYMNRKGSVADFIRDMRRKDFVEADIPLLFDYLMKQGFLLDKQKGTKKVVGKKDQKSNGIFCMNVDGDAVMKWLTPFEVRLNYYVEWYTMYRYCIRNKVVREDCKMTEFGKQWTAWTGNKKGENAMYKCSNLPSSLRYSNIDGWCDLSDVTDAMKKRITDMLTLLNDTQDKYHIFMS